MATDVQMYDLVNSTGTPFYKRLCVRLTKLAVDVKNEDPGTTNHANRVIWANAVLGSPEPMATTMRWEVIRNADVWAAEAPESTSDDGWREAKIEAAAAALINTYATGS